MVAVCCGYNSVVYVCLLYITRLIVGLLLVCVDFVMFVFRVCLNACVVICLNVCLIWLLFLVITTDWFVYGFDFVLVVCVCCFVACCYVSWMLVVLLVAVWLVICVGLIGWLFICWFFDLTYFICGDVRLFWVCLICWCFRLCC